MNRTTGSGEAEPPKDLQREAGGARAGAGPLQLRGGCQRQRPLGDRQANQRGRQDENRALLLRPHPSRQVYIF